jgi:NADH-quinone oxidoreductase subunit J
VTVVFYIAGAIALISTLLVITRRNTLHALLYLVVSLLAVAVVFYTLGAPFVAALEVIVYAGAIIVLFLFTVMLLNIGRDDAERGGALRASAWIGPGLLAVVLLAELAWAISTGATAQVGARVVEPREVGVALYGPYAIGVELASTLLLAALIGARHLGQRQRELDTGLRQTAAGEAIGGPAGGSDSDGVDSAAGSDKAATSAAETEAAAASSAAATASATVVPAAEPHDTRFWRKDDD